MVGGSIVGKIPLSLLLRLQLGKNPKPLFVMKLKLAEMIPVPVEVVKSLKSAAADPNLFFSLN